MKTFNIDWDSYEDVSRFSNVIKSRLGEINPNRISKKEKYRIIFDACMGIWETDISAHYKGLKLDESPKYYVYAHLDPTQKVAIGYSPKTSFGAILGMTHRPFYIGKGTGERCNNLNRNETHRKLRQSLETEPIVMVLKDGLTEYDALACEDKLIDIFGLKIFGGNLTNLDEGYHPKERRALYAKQYSLMVRSSREHRGSTPLPSTRPATMAAVAGGATAIDSRANDVLENSE